MEASQIIHDVSVDLNDQYPGNAYTRWSYAQLESYCQEGLVEAASAYPQLFTKQLIVPLEAGNKWQEVCECTHIKRVLGECTFDGDLLSTASERKDTNSYIWPGSTTDACYTKSLYSDLIYSYSISSVKDNTFKVYPPVNIIPPQRYVLIECYQEPDITSDIPNILLAPIKQWMLYRALIIDAENNPAIADIAKTHLQTCLSLLGKRENTSLKEEAAGDESTNNGSVRAVQDGASKAVSS